MTSGSSQGLFVIVAVVIFGIFVVISYLLFRDKLQTGLASIFSDSLIEATDKIRINENLIIFSDFSNSDSWRTWGTQGNKNTITTNNNDGTVTINKYDYHDANTYERLFFSLNTATSPIYPKLNEKYSASIEVYIDSLDNRTSTAFSSFFVRTTGTDGGVYDFGTIDLRNIEKGKWVRLEINGVTPNSKTDVTKPMNFSVALSGDSKGVLHLRRPKLEISSVATAY